MISRDIVVGPNPAVTLARHDIYLLSKNYEEREQVRDPWDKEKLVHWASIAAADQGKSFDDDIDLINWWLGDEAVVRTEKGEELLLWLRNNKGAFTHYSHGDIDRGDYLLNRDGQKVTSLRADEFSWASPIAGGVFINGEALDNSQQPNYEEALQILREGNRTRLALPEGGEKAYVEALEKASQLLWGEVLGILPSETLLTVVSTSY